MSRKKNRNKNRKTMSVPEAGDIYYELGRNASYEAARRGDIPTIRVGRLLRVPVAVMERKVGEATLTMVQEKRKPPGRERLSGGVIVISSFDDLRDNPTDPKKQTFAIPPDFDRAACPILARHWFGLDPSLSPGMAA